MATCQELELSIPSVDAVIILKVGDYLIQCGAIALSFKEIILHGCLTGIATAKSSTLLMNVGYRTKYKKRNSTSIQKEPILFREGNLQPWNIFFDLIETTKHPVNILCLATINDSPPSPFNKKSFIRTQSLFQPKTHPSAMQILHLPQTQTKYYNCP